MSPVAALGDQSAAGPEQGSDFLNKGAAIDNVGHDANTDDQIKILIPELRVHKIHIEQRNAVGRSLG